ncbi:MAG: hypothetical protein Q4E31_11985 [Intestinibacter bartlettii]|uniref:hypothetical protein n=1 Tax=Intestinibacter bartlettii TaxID=261299 RepID=UPI0026F2A048|nr:hypothetical protein [Intestinibacter bartlettii]MDO5011537.1 hypothetical protein [Intestinibacter bartlettii]
MDEKEIVRENLKYVLYAIFDNYGDLSEKIYIIIGGKQNNTQTIEYVLKKINQNTPAFIRKILLGCDDGDTSITKLKKINQNI